MVTPMEHLIRSTRIRVNRKKELLQLRQYFNGGNEGPQKALEKMISSCRMFLLQGNLMVLSH